MKVEKEVELGSKIRVWWSDLDGDRWEIGEVRRKHINSKVSYVVYYQFMRDEGCNEDDSEVIENLLGTRRVKWIKI